MNFFLTLTNLTCNIFSFQSTSNYVARKYGVRAAMPGFIAMKLCPELTIVPLNFTKYKEVNIIANIVHILYSIP